MYSVQISQAQLDQLKSLISLIEISPKVSNVKPHPSSLFIPKSQLNQVVRGFPVYKQWTVCDEGVTKTFKDILTYSFFDNDETLTQQFLSTFANSKDIIIAGGAVTAAYQAYKNGLDTRQNKYDGDIDIFYGKKTAGARAAEDMEQVIQMCKYQPVYQDDACPQNPSHKRSRMEQLRDYESMKRISRIQYFDKPNANPIDAKQIQLIQVDYEAVRSHVRTFDLSCCQMYYMQGKIYMREMYAQLTAANFMVLCWNNDLYMDTKYVERIRKYMERGFTPVTQLEDHMRQAPEDIKEKMYLITDQEQTHRFSTMSEPTITKASISGARIT